MSARIVVTGGSGPGRMSARIVVTGGSGFLGSLLARRLLGGPVALGGAAPADVAELTLVDLVPPPADSTGRADARGTGCGSRPLGRSTVCSEARRRQASVFHPRGAAGQRRGRGRLRPGYADQHRRDARRAGVTARRHTVAPRWWCSPARCSAVLRQRIPRSARPATWTTTPLPPAAVELRDPEVRRRAAGGRLTRARRLRARPVGPPDDGVGDAPDRRTPRRRGFLSGIIREPLAADPPPVPVVRDTSVEQHPGRRRGTISRTSRRRPGVVAVGRAGELVA